MSLWNRCKSSCSWCEEEVVVPMSCSFDLSYITPLILLQVTASNHEDAKLSPPCHIGFQKP